MNKKIIFALLLTSPAFSAYKSPAEQMGGEFIKGALDEVGNRLTHPDFAEGTKKTIDNFMHGAGESFKEGGEFDQMTEQASKAARRAMNTSATEVSEGMSESVSIFGQGLEKGFAEGGDFDKGMQVFVDTNAKNINTLVYEVAHKNFMTGAGIFLGTAATYYTLQYGIPLVVKMVERALLTPKLIIESSKKTIAQKLTSLFSDADLPVEMVFAPKLKQQLDDIVKVTSMINTKIKDGKTNVKYRNLMLYGPPGTGKTMFAKELAKRSGLEYAFMSGSSFSKFKDGAGIEALDELFAWAKNSKGLMIFIDEAETFLSNRDAMDPQSKAYQLLNNFLNYTGERSSQFMLVFATNHEHSLDSAMYRRIDDLIEMPLPSKQQRIEALVIYKNKILMDRNQNTKQFILSVKDTLTTQKIEGIAETTKGLSYSDLEGIINIIKTDTDIQEPALVTTDLIDIAVERAIKKHQVFTNGKLLGIVEN